MYVCMYMYVQRHTYTLALGTVTCAPHLQWYYESWPVLYSDCWNTLKMKNVLYNQEYINDQLRLEMCLRYQ